MRSVLLAVYFCLIVFGFTTAIQAQQERSNAGALAAANNNTNKPTSFSPYVKGLKLLEAGNYAEAAEALRQAIDRDPNDVAAYGKLGVAYVALRQYKDAITVLRMAIKIKPDLVGAEQYYQLGNAYTALENYSAALEAIKQAILVKRAELASSETGPPNNPPSMSDLRYANGLIYYNMHRYYVAIKELRQAIDLDSKYAPAYFGLAMSYLANGDRSAAQKQQQILESLDPVYAAQLAKVLLATKPNESSPAFGIEP